MRGPALHADVGGSGEVEIRKVAKVVGPSVDAGSRMEETVQMFEAESKEPENILVSVTDKEGFSRRPGSHVSPVEEGQGGTQQAGTRVAGATGGRDEARNGSNIHKRVDVTAAVREPPVEAICERESIRDCEVQEPAGREDTHDFVNRVVQILKVLQAVVANHGAK
jgi:hypothetical protein